MNILFLTPSNSKKNLGGVERHVRLLAEELERRGNLVKELALDSIKETPCFARSLLFKLSAWRYLWSRRKLFRWAEVIHVHDVFWWVIPFLPIIYYKSFKESPCHAARRHLKRRIFVTFHGWEGVCPPSLSAVWQKKLAAWLSDGTIGVGNFYRKWYGVKPDKVVWGVLDKSLKINKGQAFGYKGRALDTGDKIVFFGRLEEVNGVEIVIEVIKKINKGQAFGYKGRALSVVFVGDGRYREEAEKVGRVTGMAAEPWKYLAKADVVIASSYLAILEAAALGKRIIAVANNPLKLDYLERHPLRKHFKICRSAEELAGEIIRIIEETPRRGGESPLRARLWARGQTPAKLADEYEKLWAIK